MTNARGKPQKKRLANMAVEPTPAKLWTPYRAGTEEQAFTAGLLGTMARIVHVLWWDGKRLADFVLLQQVDVGGDEGPEWKDVIRVDCCHQEVHVHRMYDRNEEVYKVVRRIETPEDLQKGAEEAEAIVYDEWEEHLRRWEHGR